MYVSSTGTYICCVLGSLPNNRTSNTDSKSVLNIDIPINMSGFLRREASSGLSHSQELTWNSQSHSGTTGWATPTSRAEFTGDGRENQPGFMTSPNDLFQSSGRNTHLDLRIRELESQGQQLECAYNKEHEENVGLRAEVKVLRCVYMIYCTRVNFYFQYSLEPTLTNF